MAMAAVQGTYAMTHIDPVVSFAAFYGPEIGGEQQGVTPPGLQDHGLGLDPGYLFCQYEFSPGVIIPGFVEEQHQLHGKINVSIEILVERIETALTVLENKDGWFDLSIVATLSQEFRMSSREPGIDLQGLHPGIGDGSDRRVDCLPDLVDQIGQRILEIFIFSQTKAIPLHRNRFTIGIVCVVGIYEVMAFLRGEQVGEDAITLSVHIVGDLIPVDFLQAFGDIIAVDRWR